MSDTTSELEREAELTRARMADTADSLRAKMTPGQMIDEVAGMFRGGDGSAALANLKNQVRDNPLPLALVGAGLAWLMIGNGSKFGQSAVQTRSPSARGADFGSDDLRRDQYHDSDGRQDRDTGRLTDSELNDGPGIGERISDAASGAYGNVADVAGDLANRVGGAANATSQSVSRAWSAVGKSGQAAASTARDGADRLSGSIMDLHEREPMITAAVGLALGFAVGALLPRTSVEDEQLGKLSDDLKSQATDLASEAFDQAKEVAGDGLEALKDAADEAGLKPGEQPIARKVEEVLRSTAEAAETSIRERLDQSRE